MQGQARAVLTAMQWLVQVRVIGIHLEYPYLNAVRVSVSVAYSGLSVGRVARCLVVLGDVWLGSQEPNAWSNRSGR